MQWSKHRLDLPCFLHWKLLEAASKQLALHQIPRAQELLVKAAP